VTAPLVLLAEDDDDVRALAELVLRRAGFEVTAVTDGDAALAAAEQHEPAVAVLDVSMPHVDGLEAARRLRERGATFPIMLLTARVTEADRERGRLAGADAQLDKPFSPAVLAERVRALCDGGPTRETDR
jgi:DNA-binding response OmpR family regulator